jgi:hypothetical protein
MYFTDSILRITQRVIVAAIVVVADLLLQVTFDNNKLQYDLTTYLTDRIPYYRSGFLLCI